MVIKSWDFKIGNQNITDHKTISNKFNDYFANIGNTLARKIEKSKNHYLDYMPRQSSFINSCVFSPTTRTEIISITKALKNTFSSGYDNIPISVIKSVIECVADQLTEILNLCISKAVFPDNMKIAKVCPIHKSGETNDPSNYRPISILSSFSKIFEKIITIRLRSYVEKEQILSNCQFGFRKKHSTYMALLKLYDTISEAIEKNEYCVGIFVDLSKAFDTLDHNILIDKLMFYGVRGIPNLLLKSFLTDR